MFFQQQDSTAINDTPGEVDFNPGMLIEKLDTWLDGFVRLLPNIGVAIVVAIIFYFLSRFVKNTIIKSTARRDRENLGRVAGGFVRWIILVMGLMFALTIVIPTLKPGDLIAGLGVSSVAIGFAFKDILQNWLAGLLILLRQPFEIGDQIIVEGFEGTVERIETRATIIRQYNNVRIVVPNSEIYTNAVKVKTANDLLRSQYDVGIGYGDDIQKAVQVARETLQGIEGIEQDKGVDVLPWDLAASWVTIRLRWWTDSERAQVVQTHARVIKAIKEAMDKAKIDMPYDTKVQLIHDQTDEYDGDADRQREGWFWGEDKEKPRPLWEAKMEKAHELKMKEKKAREEEE